MSVDSLFKVCYFGKGSSHSGKQTQEEPGKMASYKKVQYYWKITALKQHIKKRKMYVSTP